MYFSTTVIFYIKKRNPSESIISNMINTADCEDTTGYVLYKSMLLGQRCEYVEPPAGCFQQ